MNRRQAKKILRRDAPDDLMRKIFGAKYAVFEDVRPMRRGRSKALAIHFRDTTNLERRYGRWSPLFPDLRIIARERDLASAERMRVRVQALLDARKAAP